jgi:hypothetical protein
VGKIRLFANGKQIVDLWDAPQHNGSAMYGQASDEVIGEIEVKAGEPVELVVQYSSEQPPRVGGAPNNPSLLVSPRPLNPSPNCDQCTNADPVSSEAFVLAVLPSSPIQKQQFVPRPRLPLKLTLQLSVWGLIRTGNLKAATDRQSNFRADVMTLSPQY